MIGLNIVRFCARECELQLSGERSVAWMTEAWEYAQKNDVEVVNGGLMPCVPRLPTVDDVLNLGRLVEPFKNAQGFRTVGVRVGWDVKMEWAEVPEFMVNVTEALHDGRLSNEEFIYESLGMCHPFRDGNGRTHQILWNWLEGTLDNPTWHKNFWNDPRRLPGDGAEDDHGDISPLFRDRTGGA